MDKKRVYRAPTSIAAAGSFSSKARSTTSNLIAPLTLSDNRQKTVTAFQVLHPSDQPAVSRKDCDSHTMLLGEEDLSRQADHRASPRPSHLFVRSTHNDTSLRKALEAEVLVKAKVLRKTTLDYEHRRRLYESTGDQLIAKQIQNQDAAELILKNVESAKKNMDIIRKIQKATK